MPENKTKPTDQNVEAFLHAVEHKQRREDAFALLKLMEEITGQQATMWGSTIVGFGTHHYTYETGREGDMPLVGFSPRKQNMTIYLMPDTDTYGDMLGKLGKYKTGKVCLYINKLGDIDTTVLRQLIERAYGYMKEKQP